MKSLLVKVLAVTAVLCMVTALSLVSHAQADSSMTVTVMLEAGSTNKQTSIPRGYRPHTANLILVGSGTDEFTVRVIVGNRQAELSWPSHASASLQLNLREDVSTVPVSALAPLGFAFVVKVEIICVKASQL